MKDKLKLLWIFAAFSLVASTMALDLRALPGQADGGTGVASARSRQTAHLALTSGGNTQLTPSLSLEYDLCPGDTRSFQQEFHVPPAPLRADILFAFDTTNSMEDVIETAQDRASEIMSSLQGLIGDVRFGVVDFRDYPFFLFGRPGDWAYELRQPLTHDTTEVQTEVEDLEADGGGRWVEAYTRIVYEAYADDRIGWRPGLRHFLIVFGDDVPHDNDLNDGIPAPQPNRPGGVWNTGAYPPYLDPGRDMESGTADDLDLQPELRRLGDHSITLLFVASGISDDLELRGLVMEDFLVYWRHWASLTGPGGDARALENVADLPVVVESLVTEAARRIEQLTVRAEPALFAPWVRIVPNSYEDLVVPAGGLTRNFEITVTVPNNASAGEYTLDLVVEADGTDYGRRQITISVPETCFAPPTPTWAPAPTLEPRRSLYLPFVARNHMAWR